MASFKYSTGRRAEAEPYLRRIADASEGPEGTLALVDYYLLTARPKDAIASIEGLKSGRDVPAVTLRLARAHAAAGDRQKARSLVDQILKANDKDAAAQLLKGQLLLEDGRRKMRLRRFRPRPRLPLIVRRRSVRAWTHVRHSGR